MKNFTLTMLMAFIGVLAMAQGTETFTNISSSTSAYGTVTWTGDNGLQWQATDARTDQPLNGKAVGLRAGTISCTGIPNGIGSLQFSYKYLFSGSAGNLEVRINGVQVGSVTVPSTQTTAATASFPNLNVGGAFTLEIQQTVAGGPRVDVDDITWTGYNGTPCTTPSSQATGLNFSSVTNNSVYGTFTAASPAADEYLVIRSSSSTLSATPQNGTEYTDGEIIGNGTVVTSANSNNFTDASLTAGTTYYYFVFSLNNACSGGPNYNTTSPLTASVTTTAPPACVAPTSAPGTITTTSASTSINGSFVDATGADGYLVIRSRNNALSFTPANGTSYTTGQTVGAANDGVVIKYDVGNTFGSSGLTQNTTYYFYVFAVSGFNCTGGPLYNATASKATATTANNSTGEPAGYYSSTTGLSCEPLKTTLKNIITNGHTPQSYDALWNQYKVTDIKPREVGSGSANVIWDIYSDRPTAIDPYNYTPGTNQCGNYSGEGICYNREHSFPKSWFNDEMPAYSDYNHIFPTDGYVNGKRSNYRYGEVASATFTSLNGSKLGSSSTAGISGTVFEPINEYKGDVARAYLYMVTRYQDRVPTWVTYQTDGALTMQANTYPSVNVNYLKLMIKWHTQDPVSTKEIDRNNGTYSFQGNRNPFIDHPEFVDAVWNSNCPGLAALPVDIVYFGGKLNGDKVQLNWTVENELSLDSYEIQKSINGAYYKTIGIVKAANSRQYQYIDNVESNRGQRVYYRIKKTDRDGSFKYSEVFSIHVPLNTKFSVYPNPASSFIQLQLNNTLNGFVTIRVHDIAGRLAEERMVKVSGSTITLSTDKLSSGTYFVSMNVNGEQYMQKVVISK